MSEHSNVVHIACDGVKPGGAGEFRAVTSRLDAVVLPGIAPPRMRTMAQDASENMAILPDYPG